MGRQRARLIVSAGVFLVLVLVAMLVTRRVGETPGNLSSTSPRLPFFPVKSSSWGTPHGIATFLREHPQFGSNVIRCIPTPVWTPGGSQIVMPTKTAGRYRVETEKQSYLFDLEKGEVVRVMLSETAVLLWRRGAAPDSVLTL